MLLAAWLGNETLKLKDQELARIRQAIPALRERLAACGFDWLIGQLEGAQAIIENRAPDFLSPGGRSAGAMCWRRCKRWG
jgi:hypothetical protein